MKKIALMLMSFVTVQMIAQDKPSEHRNEKSPRVENRMKMTVEETATLQTKRMTLQLDLTDAQQARVKTVLLEEAKHRENMRIDHKKFMEENKSEENKNEELIKEKRLEIMNARLDRQIKMKAHVKDILNREQYEKWESHFMKPQREGRRKQGPRGKTKTGN